MVETAGVDRTKAEANVVQVMSDSTLALVSMSWTNAWACHRTMVEAMVLGMRNATLLPHFLSGASGSPCFSLGLAHTPRLNWPDQPPCPARLHPKTGHCYHAVERRLVNIRPLLVG